MTLRKSIPAFQWFKNNDHPRDQIGDRLLPDDKGPLTKVVNGVEIRCRLYTAQFRRANDWEGQVVRRFRHPGVEGSTRCKKCQRTMNVHGWIDPSRNGGKEYTVCPADYIVTNPDGTYTAMDPRDFIKLAYQH